MDLHLAQVTGARLLAKRDSPWTLETIAKRRSLSKSPLERLARLNSVSTMDGRPSPEGVVPFPPVGEAAAAAAVALICSSVAAFDSRLLPIMLSMLNVVLLAPLLRTDDEPGELGVVGLLGVDSGENCGTEAPLLCRDPVGERWMAELLAGTAIGFTMPLPDVG